MSKKPQQSVSSGRGPGSGQMSNRGTQEQARLEFQVSSTLPALSACKLEAPEELKKRVRLLADDPVLADFSCPICFDPLWQPVRTVCGHAFCESCLLPAILTQLENSMRPEVSCPICRHALDVDDVSLDHDLATRIRVVVADRCRQLESTASARRGHVHRGTTHSQCAPATASVSGGAGGSGGGAAGGVGGGAGGGVSELVVQTGPPTSSVASKVSARGSRARADLHRRPKLMKGFNHASSAELDDEGDVADLTSSFTSVVPGRTVGSALRAAPLRGVASFRSQGRKAPSASSSTTDNLSFQCESSVPLEGALQSRSAMTMTAWYSPRNGSVSSVSQISTGSSAMASACSSSPPPFSHPSLEARILGSSATSNNAEDLSVSASPLTGIHSTNRRASQPPLASPGAGARLSLGRPAGSASVSISTSAAEGVRRGSHQGSLRRGTLFKKPTLGQVENDQLAQSEMEVCGMMPSSQRRASNAGSQDDAAVSSSASTKFNTSDIYGAEFNFCERYLQHLSSLDK